MTEVIIQPGDKVRCIADESAWTLADLTVVDGPDFGVVLTVRKTGVLLENGEMLGVLWFDEYPGDTIDDAFDCAEFELA